MLTKAEILWTRKCPLKCDYCAMATGQKNSVSLNDWIEGFDNLKQLGCSFAAFYGAEPLADFNNLPDVVGYAESIGIATTVITSGAVPYLQDKLKFLYDKGAKSVSMSYDIVGDNLSSTKKTGKAIPALLYFKSLGNIRDVAAIATIHRKNFQLLPEMIKVMTEYGIWTLFDFIHPDRGQPGSKCRSYPGIEDLLFTIKDVPDLIEILSGIKGLKKRGYLVHSSDPFLDHIIADPLILLNYGWNCAKENEFPSWVTVDCTGLVYPCDDFQDDTFPLYVWELAKNFGAFSTVWKNHVRVNCPGCVWNTHIDSHAIKRGTVKISDYIHKG